MPIKAGGACLSAARAARPTSPSADSRPDERRPPCSNALRSDARSDQALIWRCKSTRATLFLLTPRKPTTLRLAASRAHALSTLAVASLRRVVVWTFWLTHACRHRLLFRAVSISACQPTHPKKSRVFQPREPSLPPTQRKERALRVDVRPLWRMRRCQLPRRRCHRPHHLHHRTSPIRRTITQRTSSRPPSERSDSSLLWPQRVPPWEARSRAPRQLRKPFLRPLPSPSHRRPPLPRRCTCTDALTNSHR